jgi:amino acid adenylation domain-containing protein
MSDGTLYAWFAESARRHPDAVAVEVCGRSLTYRELREASDRLARRIERAPGGRADRIGLFAARTPLAYIGYLAIIRTGAAVVPLNPLFPPERNGSIADNAGLRIVIGDDSLTGDWTRSRVVLTGDEPGVGAPAPYQGRADDVAYILFTSGSTGTPKGLPIRHRNVTPYLAYNIARYGVAPGCRLSQTFDLTFDPSVFDMFVTWGAGATLVVPQRDEMNDPARFVAVNRLTHWFSVPSVASLAARMRRLTPASMPDLRWSLFAGEQLTLAQARAWAGAAPSSQIENIYGPTELTVTCTGYQLPRDPRQWPDTSNNTVPIGFCYPHLEHVVLDVDGKPSSEGELCVRGPQRFDGYLDENNNRSRFLTYDPAGDEPARDYDGTTPLTAEHWYRTGDRVVTGPDGSMLHLGRLDSQVQLHGYRVELGDIEANLRTHPDVDEAAVLVHDGELRAIYTGAALGAGTLVAWLAERVPAYMVPRTYTFVDLMPRNDNGKLDRRKLEAIPC